MDGGGGEIEGLTSRCIVVCICVQCHPLKTNLRQTSLSKVLLKAMVINISAVLFSLILVVVGGGLFQANMCKYIFFNIYMYAHHLRLNYVNLEKKHTFF